MIPALRSAAPPHPAAAALAMSVAAAAAAAAALWLAAALLPSPPPARAPFGTGLAEPAGAVAWLNLVQAEYGRRLTEAVLALRGGSGWAWLAGLSFAYGVVHAAGPGHGKAVVSAYILADGAGLRRGVGAAAGAALFQAALAAVLAGGAYLAAGGPDGLRAGSARIEAAGFLAMAAFGAWLLWRRASALSRGTAPCGPGCGHAHAAPSARGALAAAAVAGSRPCSGAVLVLLLAFSQGMPVAGAAAVGAMAAGTALTTSSVAAASVYAKALALRAAGGAPGPLARMAAAGELVAAAAILVLGLALAAGAAGLAA